MKTGASDSVPEADHFEHIVISHILGNGIAEVESIIPLAELAEKYGTVPLPPYLHRDATADDKKRYQTVWAKDIDLKEVVHGDGDEQHEGDRNAEAEGCLHGLRHGKV